jgi:hypothetical protein
LYLLGHLVALYAFVEAAFYWHGSYDQQTVNYVLAMCCYVVIYLGLGAALSRLARKIIGDFRPAHARVLTLLLLAMGAILPQTLYFFDQFNNWATPQYWITDPFHTLTTVGSGHIDAALLMRLLAAGTVVVLAINVRSIWRGIVDVVRVPVSPPMQVSAIAADITISPQPAQAKARTPTANANRP